MNPLNKQYQDLLQTILDYGTTKMDRTETGTKSIFGYTIRHRYYPDIYIKSENQVIEVKSTYTFNKEKEKNLLKQDSVLNKNINFKFVIL